MLNKNNRFAARQASQLVGGETELADKGWNTEGIHQEMVGEGSK